MGELVTGTDHLLGRIDDQVAVLSFNRPERRNALSDQIYAGLARALAQVNADRNVRVVMITGEGGAFCAGGDVKNMNERNQSPTPLSFDDHVAGIRKLQNPVILGIRNLPQPVVAALPGPVAGAGLSIALAADLRIAAESAFVITAFSNIGASGDFGTSWFLPRLVGEAKAKELLFLSPRLTASEARQLGIINHVISESDFQKAALEWCHELAQRAPLALREMKANVNRASDVPLEAGLDAEATAMALTMRTADHREAAAAFVEKRSATFTGS
jgi:2-(1,2-epoxy-1,2-dihydrophenyl)acetyl-CoA isomerase